MMKQQYDIIIIGGGLVGLSLACQLGDTNFSIAIIDSKPPILDLPKEGFDLRVSAITRVSQNTFAKLGIWEKIKAIRVSPFKEMQVWDAQGTGSIHFDSATIAEPDIGHIIENKVMQKALFDRIREFSNIDYFHSITTRSLEENNNSYIVELEDDKKISCSLLVGADGANSWVRKQVNISINDRPYGHHALVATVETEHSHKNTAWQCFLETGPLAFLPLSDENFCSIVWSTNPEHADTLKNMDEETFKSALGEAFDFRLGNIKDISKRVTFPLHMRHANTYVKEGLALVGDAAHTIHPLAGQGVNLGFSDAACLAEELLSAKQKGRDFASLNILRKYERIRRAENQEMILIMDLFKQLFGSKSKTIKALRNIGLNITDVLQPLKNMIIRQAMG